MSSVVVVVGQGRMGSAFVSALRLAKVPYRTLPGREVRPLRRPRGARRVRWLLAVTDAAIATVAERLRSSGVVAPVDTMVHLAGMRGVSELGPDDRAFHRAALHPLVAVSDPARPPTLRGATASFVGDEVALRAVRALCRPLGLHVVPLPDGARETYHAAAALMATGAVALAQGASALWHSAFPALDPAARALFAQSLLASVAHNVVVSGPAGALASPLLRGDTEAVRKHLAVMEVVPSARAIYQAALQQVLAEPSVRATLPKEVLERAQRLVRDER